MVFGSEGNPTHWKRLSKEQAGRLSEGFRSALYKRTNLSARTWKEYWKQIVDFRNKYAAHREGEYNRPVPRFDQALEVAYAYDEWVRDIISPDILGEPRLKISAAKVQQSIEPLIRALLTKTKEYKNT